MNFNSPLRRFHICLIFLFILFFQSDNVRSEETPPADSSDKTFFEFLKGNDTANQFYAGMWTFHFDPKSRRKDNWNQNLLGFQYNDFFLCVFQNSFYNWTVAAGFGRNLYSSKLSANWDMNIGYRLGVDYGYKDGEAPFANVSPIIPIVELYNQYYFKEHWGVEIMLTTSISVGLFYQF